MKKLELEQWKRYEEKNKTMQTKGMWITTSIELHSIPNSNSKKDFARDEIWADEKLESLESKLNQIYLLNEKKSN